MGISKKMSLDKSNSHRNSGRAITPTTKIAANPAQPARVHMKNQGKTNMPSQTLPKTLEQEYVRLFPVPKAPERSFYVDDYDLRQPSVLKYVPSTTSPNAEV